MAERNERHKGLVLHARDTARGDRIIDFLCDEGLLSLFLFGGPKSTLRSAATPFVSAEIEVYRDRRSDFIKLTGVNILETYEGIQKSFSHMQTASGAAEFILHTSAFGGEYSQALAMMTSLLRELDEIDERHAGLALHIFLWKALVPLGLAPDTSACERCGRPFSEKGSLPGRLLMGERSLLCAACAEERREQGFPVSAMIWFDAEALSCLKMALQRSYGEAAQMVGASSSSSSVRAIIESLAESAAEGPLQSLRLFH
ncbi:MAG: DNA repair protein RecO [Rectinema sp.]